MHGKTDLVHQILILQQIKFEKNGFHRLVGKGIGFKGANFLRNSIIWCWMMLIFVELLIYQVLTSNQMHGKMAAVYRIFILHQIKLSKKLNYLVLNDADFCKATNCEAVTKELRSTFAKDQYSIYLLLLTTTYYYYYCCCSLVVTQFTSWRQSIALRIDVTLD